MFLKTYVFNIGIMHFVGIIINNFFACLATIFLGYFLCKLELRIYRKVSLETYRRFDRAFDPFYSFLGKMSSIFRKAKPCFRSCLLYLILIPSLALILNTIVIFYVLVSCPKYLLPHGILEIPAIYASVYLGYSIFEHNKNILLSEKFEISLPRGIFVKVSALLLAFTFSAWLECMA